MQDLESKFFGLCNYLCMDVSLGGFNMPYEDGKRITDKKIAGIYADLKSRYAEPHRRYHTLAHVSQCLQEFDMVRDFARNPHLLEFAIWLHDAIYAPGNDDNEERSIHLASNYLEMLDSRVELGHLVSGLIRATEHLVSSSIGEISLDEKLMRDIDLSVLGKDEWAFASYERDVRLEYSHLPDEVYRDGRVKVLRHFLSMPRIYTTSVFHHLYEKIARFNIQGSLDELLKR